VTRTFLFWGMTVWLGATLVLSEVRWFARTPLAERLRPYTPGGMGRTARSGILSAETFREAIGPVARRLGERLSRLMGVAEDLDVRLLRIHSSIDVTGFRIRQLGYAVAGFGAAILFVVAVPQPAIIGLFTLLAVPTLAFLLQEQRLAAASARWQRRLFLELPVVAEQLSLLLSSGYSLSAAINRTAARSDGACGADLARVGLRIRQGLSEGEALREWAALADVDALGRLVPILALSGETSDLGRLVSEEARAIRRDVQRERIEAAERRAEQVWIPVTVAALVPGVIFLAVPFIEALRIFGQ
jgi:tight adherence protein C